MFTPQNLFNPNCLSRSSLNRDSLNPPTYCTGSAISILSLANLVSVGQNMAYVLFIGACLYCNQLEPGWSNYVYNRWSGHRFCSEKEMRIYKATGYWKSAGRGLCILFLVPCPFPFFSLHIFLTLSSLGALAPVSYVATSLNCDHDVNVSGV